MPAALLVPWEISVLRLSLVLICCSTWLYITSCWVNWLESIGLVGSWFLSWVVNSVRKVEKLPDNCFIASGVDVVLVVAVEAAGGTAIRCVLLTLISTPPLPPPPLALLTVA